MAVPKNMQEKYDEIAAIIVPCCEEHLSDEYKKLCLHALEKLCRKRPSPLLSGRAKTWAAGIVYAIGSNNMIFYKDSRIHKSAQEIADMFDISKNTIEAKGAEVRRFLKISFDQAEWILESEIENTTAIWLVAEGPYGFPKDARTLPLDVQIMLAEQGVIPYVPALKKQQEAGKQAEENKNEE